MEDLVDTTSTQIAIILVGNKTDLDAERTVSQEWAEQLAKNYGVEYMECSALTGEHIDQIFMKLAR